MQNLANGLKQGRQVSVMIKFVPMLQVNLTLTNNAMDGFRAASQQVKDALIL